MIPDGPSGFVPDPRVTEYPGTYIRDWVMLCPDIPDSAYRAYSIIRAHIWEKDVERTVKLTQAQIAKMLGKSEERTRKILKPLLQAELLTIAEKRQWWERNPKLDRRERRTMNVYAVNDFPPADYDGPKSLKDFGLRFTAQSTDRAETTGRAEDYIPAGHADRAETTAGPSSQASDVFAGHADRSKMTSPAVENDRPYKKPFQEQEGEEGVARTREAGDSSVGEEPVWGVQGGASFAAPTLASAHLIRDIAGQALLPGETLTAADHQRLAMLVEAARPVVEAQKGLSWDEYEAWLRQGWVRADGRRTFRSLVGALAWRLAPEQIQGQAWAWACERRGAQEASEAQGARDVPSPRAGVHASFCGRHGTTLTDNGRCLACEREATEEDRQRETEQAAAGDGVQNRGEYVDYDDEPDMAEIDPAILEQMYRSAGVPTGTPPTEIWKAAREAMEEGEVSERARAR